MPKKQNRLEKIYRVMVLVLPVVLYFSYYPVISLGMNETMNFELSLPLIWLVIFDVLVAVMLVRRRKLSEIWKRWWSLLFPVFASLSIMWSSNVVRGVLTCGILWLIYIAVMGMWALRELTSGEEFSRRFFKWFMGASLAICAWCIAQCVMDAMGVSRECSLLCLGCTSRTFGFPHPNGFAIEPQFMGNLLLAPTIVAIVIMLNKQKLEPKRSRGDNFYNGPVGVHTKLQFRDSLRGCCKNHAGSRFLCSDFCLFSIVLVLTMTLFLTFSRGAIYAFFVAMMFVSGLVLARERKKILKRLGVVWLTIILAFLFTLNLQGVLAQMSPTNDTYATGVAKVLNHLSLGIIDIRGEKIDSDMMENTDEVVGQEDGQDKNEAIFDGYVEESTNVRMEMTENALKAWSRDFGTVMFGVGIGSAGQAMYDAGLTSSPKEIVQNEYVNVLLEMGVVGVALAALALIMVIKICVRNTNGGLILTLLVAYGVTLCFFSGLPNALQIYLMPGVLGVALVQKSTRH